MSTMYAGLASIVVDVIAAVALAGIAGKFETWVMNP